MRVSNLIVVLAVWAGTVTTPVGAVTLVHSGASNPLTEGFTTSVYLGSPVLTPVLGDQGYDAWQVSMPSTAAQFGYVSGPPSLADRAAFAQGFGISLVARVMQGSSASVYSSANPVILASAGLDGPTRYNIHLGLDTNGDVVVVLPQSIDDGGGGGRIRARGGLSYTLTGLGSGYHRYELVFGPIANGAQIGTLYVDGIERLSGYSGYTNIYGSNGGFSFYTASGGVVRYAQTQISAVPEPAQAWLLLAGLLALVPLRQMRLARLPPL